MAEEIKYNADYWNSDTVENLIAAVCCKHDDLRGRCTIKTDVLRDCIEAARDVQAARETALSKGYKEAIRKTRRQARIIETLRGNIRLWIQTQNQNENLKYELMDELQVTKTALQQNTFTPNSIKQHLKASGCNVAIVLFCNSSGVGETWTIKKGEP